MSDTYIDKYILYVYMSIHLHLNVPPACIFIMWKLLKISVDNFHLQALDQCEMTLSKLGIIRVSAEDTAGAAQVKYKSIRDSSVL